MIYAFQLRVTKILQAYEYDDVEQMYLWVDEVLSQTIKNK